MADRLCKDCKFCRDPGEFAECRAPQNRVTERCVTQALVTGKSIEKIRHSYRWIYCSTQRDGGLIESWITRSCGSAGRWWAPKHTNGKP